jgi:hypothetical protein
MNGTELITSSCELELELVISSHELKLEVVARSYDLELELIASSLVQFLTVKKRCFAKPSKKVS